jgi:hypothetical protein
MGIKYTETIDIGMPKQRGWSAFFQELFLAVDYLLINSKYN